MAEVTEADRAEAMRALFGDDWSRDMGPRWREYVQGARPQAGMDMLAITPDGLALELARVRIAAERAGYERGVRDERERCAAQVEAQALLCERDIAASPAILGAIVEMLRGLAEQMRGGGGV